MKAASTMRVPEFSDEPLPDGLLGDYDRVGNLIRLDPRQLGWQYRCTLEHEWVHAERGDEPTGEWSLDAKMERAAEQEAARRLISLDDLMDAVAWASSLAEVASELHVDPATVLARIDCLDDEDRAAIRGRLALKGEVA